jgi:tripartite-type tricarboxylate transporter receptor subunit TctC
MHRLVGLLAIGAAVVSPATAAQSAHDYPSRPLRMIIPFGPGGASDTVARALQPKLERVLGHEVIFEHRPGAAGNIGMEIAARAAPDGYTLLLGSSSGLTTNPAFGNKLDYDPVKDFAAVGLGAHVPQLLVVHPSLPVKNVNGLIDLAKAQPGRISFGSPGVGSVGHLSIEVLTMTTGARFVHVPYKGAGPAVIDLIADRIQAFFGSVTGTQPQVAAGRIRAIATGHVERLRSMPALPTVAESLPGFTNNGWYGIFAPAGTPAPIIDKLNAEMRRALANPEFSKHIEAIGMEPAGSTPQELRDWVRNELAHWTKVVRDAGIQPPKN